MRLFATALVAIALVGCASLDSTAQPPPRRDVGLLQRAWRWTDEQGADVTLARWSGGPLVLSAFFTSCTVRCPLTLEALRRLDEAMRRKGQAFEFALVTLDPATDDPARLRRFKKEHRLPETWHLLQGSLTDTREFARFLGLRAIPDDGHIDHDVRIVIFDARGRLVRQYSTWEFDPETAAIP